MQFEEFDSFTSAPAADAQVASSSDRLQYLVDNAPAVIYCTVPSGDFKMTFVSNNALHMLGYRPQDMLADQNFWFDHIHPDDAPTIFSSLAQVFVEGQRAYEYRFRCADGDYRWMHDTLRLIRDAHGAPLEVIGAMTDITVRKQMEESLRSRDEEQQRLIGRLQEAHDQLLQSEKMASIGQLAAGIAHEINNPVGFVNSNMGTLQGYLDTLFKVLDAYATSLAAHGAPPALQQQLAAVRAQADLDFLQEDAGDLMRESMDGLKRVKDIVQSLTNFSHVGENEWQDADLHAGIDSTLNIVANQIKYKATVVKEYGAVPTIVCMASQLNQVFMNLLVNAAHAIKERGTITIRTAARDGWVAVAISDTGSGIAPENLNRIFEPFFTTKPIGTGTGLGLSLSYGIVNKHGGRIEVSSTLGQGTTFTVHLPCKPPAAKT